MTARKNSRGAGIPDLTARNQELESRVRELEEILDAIRSGEVDAIVVSRDNTQKVYSLEGPDHPYRALVESIPEGALTLSADGIILYANSRFASMIGTPLDRIIGIPFSDFVSPDDQPRFREVLNHPVRRPCEGKVKLCLEAGDLPVSISLSPLSDAPGSKISILMYDRRDEVAQIREREEQLRLVMNNLPVLISQLDRECRYIRVNESYRRWFGLSPRDIEGRHVREVIGDDAWEIVRPRLERAMAGETVTYEQYMPYLNGGPRWTAGTFVPNRDEAGEVQSIVALVTDITAQKQIESDIRESRKKYQDLIETTSDFIWEMDAEGRYTYCSPQMEKLWGLRPADMIGKTPFDVMPADHRADVQAFFQHMIQSPRPFSGLETVAIADQNRLVHIETSGVPFFNEKGALIGFRGISRDITERKRAEDALRESEFRYRTVSENTYDWEFWLDPEGRFLYCSPSCERITGHGNEEFLADPDLRRRLIHPDDRERYDRHVKAEREQRGEGSGTWRFVGPAGSWRWIEHICQPVYGGGGEFLGIRASNRDITDRREAEEALRESEARSRILSGTAGKLLSATDPQAVIEKLCRDVMSYLDCQVFFNFLVDDRAGRLRLNAAAGIPEEEQKRIEWLDFGAAVCGWVAENGTRLIAEDIQNHPEPRTDLVRSYGIQAYCCHPLMSGMRPIGTLSFGTTSRSRFTPAEVDLMRIVADQVSIAVARIRSERELHETSQYLENLVNYANAPIIVWDPEFRITRFNHASERLTGRTAEDVTGRGLGILFPEESKRDSMDHIRRTMEGERWEAVEIPILHRSGEVRTVLWNSASLYGQDGTTVTSAIAQGQDITERKQAEEALRESEDRFRTIAETSPVHIIVSSRDDGSILFTNASYDQAFGFARGELLGKQAPDLYCNPVDRTVLMDILKRGGTVRDREVRVRRKDGTSFWVAASVTPIRFSGRDALLGASLDITERMHTAKALRESEERFRMLYQDLPVSAVVFQWVGGDFVIREYNQAAQDITGGTMEKFVGRTARDLYGSRPDILEKFALAWETKSPQNLQTRYRMVSTGQDIFMNVTLAYIPPDRILVLTEDNSELRKYEWELRETSQYLENLINYANTPIIVWDPQFRITRFNHAFERLTGRNAGEVLGRDLAILFPSITMEESMEQIRRAMAGERWEAVEIPILHKNGEMRTVLWNSATVYGADGKTVVSAIAQGQDITERKRAEEEVGLKAAEIAAANVALREEITQRIQAGEALERTMALLKATFESTADGILSVDADGVVAGFNQNFVTMWNVPFALIQTPDMDAILQHMAAQLADPEGFLASTADLSPHQGRESYDMLELQDGRIFERDSRPQRIEHDIVGRVWSYRDITERKRAEERILASLNEKEVLLREIHHRVKNNLQLISGLLDLTRLRTQDPETLSILTDMMLKIQTMAQIHTRLYESKRFDRVNMGRQIQDQITSLSQIYGQRDREILCETELADLYLPIDQAIPCALAVNEILSNAFKHAFKGRAHGSLRVMASQEDSRVRITVRDDGRGIPTDLDIARSRSLGLKLIRNLVENQLKGSLTIHGEGGTEVIVEFPILSQEEEHVTDSRSG